MSRVWSDEAKLEHWLAVELAALDAWAQVGSFPPRASLGGVARELPTPERVAELEQTTNNKLQRSRRRASTGRRGRCSLRAHVLRRRRHGPRDHGAERRGVISRRHRPLANRRTRSEEHRHTAGSAGRTHPREPTTVGIKPSLGVQLARPSTDRTRASRMRSAASAGGTTRPDAGGRADRVRGARARVGTEYTSPPGDRHADSLGARDPRVVARPFRDRRSAPCSTECARWRTVRTRPEGLVGDVAQRNPISTSHLRDRSAVRATRSSGSERRP